MGFKDYIKEDKQIDESAGMDLFEVFFKGLIKVLPTALVSKGLKELVKSVSKDYDGLRLNQYRTSIKKLGEHLIKVNPKLASTFKEIDAELKDR